MDYVLTDYLDKAIEKCPDKMAFIDESGNITYGELYNQAQLVANILYNLNIFHQPALILLPPCIQCAVFAYAVAYSGNYYTIADAEMGKTSLMEEIEEYNPSIILTNQKGKEYLSSLCICTDIITYEEVINQNSILEKRISRAISKDAIFVIFTSGSTGRPKGVVHSHKSVIDGVEKYTTLLSLNEGAKLAEFNANMFGIFSMNLFNVVACGGMEYIFSSQEKIFLAKAFKIIEQLRLNRIVCIAYFLEFAIRQKCLINFDVTSLEVIGFVGTPVSAQTINAWRNAIQNVKLRQYYGASEALMSTWFEVMCDYKDDEIIPIGKPVEDAELLVLNEMNQVVNCNEIGELYIRSGNLALGYYRDRKKTDTVFLQNPSHTDYLDIVYKTGDFVRRDKNGNYIFVGRADTLIKRRGYRIELSEIDVKTTNIKEVNECISLFDKETDKIFLFYEGQITEVELYEKIKLQLRSYMLPDRVIRLDCIPHGINMKVDRSKLLDSIVNK